MSFNGKEIKTDITATQVALWNAGKSPVRSTDILTPVTLQISSSAPILEASIRKTSRATTRPTLNIAEVSSGKLGIDWNILEQNDGFVIQLIYAGTPDLPITISGAVVGQNSLAELHYGGNIIAPAEQYRPSARIERWVNWGMMTTAVITLIFGLRSLRESGPDRWSPDRWSIPWLVIRMLIILLLILIGMTAYTLYSSSLPEPPFGFK